MTVIVFAVQRVFLGGTWTKLGKEALERRKPKFDASLPIARIGLRVRILATTFCIYERPILWRKAAAVASESFACLFGMVLTPKASTRGSVARFHAIAAGDTFLTTVADHVPQAIASTYSFACVAHDDESAKTLPSQVDESPMSRNWPRTNVFWSVSHGIFSLVENRLARLVREAQTLWRAASILPLWRYE
jgi:hypothetical protein